ncbi:MAG: GumC family protein [Bacteroidia bacterium]
MSYHVGINRNDFVKDAEAKLNSALDISLILHLLAKYKWYFLFVFFAASVLSFLYLRYTQPVYEAKAVVQINDNKTDQVLHLEGINESENAIAEAIEQIHSKIFLNRIVEKLNLSVSYFSEGTFKNNELYKSSPFLVTIKINNGALYNTPIYVSLNSNNLSDGVITVGKKSTAYKINEWVRTPDYDINVYLNPEIDQNRIKSILNSNNAFYFTVQDLDASSTMLQDKLEIKVFNELAKTILIKLKDVNAMKVVDVVNAISQEYLNYDVERKSESSRNVLDFIDKQLSLVYNDLKNTESDLKKFKNENNVNTNDQKLASDLLRASNIDDQLLKVEMEERIIAEVQESIDKNKSIDIYQLISIISGTEYESMIRDVIQNIQSLLNKKENLLYSVTPSAENIKQINYQIENQKKLLLESLDAVKLRYKAKYKSLLDKSSDYKNKLNTSPDEEVELSRLNRLYSISEKYYTLLLEKKTEFSISKAGYVTKNIILEKANGIGSKVYPSSRNTILLATIASILIIFLGLVGLYFTHNQIYSIHDIMKFSNQGASLIGIVPKYENNIPVSQLIVDKNPKSIISEAFRTIRTNLSFIDNTPGSKIIAVSSTISGEGKTFVSINIAGILAFTGKKVVLIDLDMRKPKIHKGFGVLNEKGMSSILTGVDEIHDCFNDTTMDNYKFITAGPTPPNPSELILSDKLTQVLDKLKSEFDFVVIDNAPVGLVTDGIETLRKADYPIYVFRADYSDKHFIQNLIRLKNENHIARLSGILNDIDLTKKQYGYNYGYNYGY